MTATETVRPYDLTGQVIAWEQGELDEEGAASLFQHLINNGMAWSLQGAYGRTAVALIRLGLCEATTPAAKYYTSREGR